MKKLTQIIFKNGDFYLVKIERYSERKVIIILDNEPYSITSLQEDPETIEVHKKLNKEEAKEIAKKEVQTFKSYLDEKNISERKKRVFEGIYKEAEAFATKYYY